MAMHLFSPSGIEPRDVASARVLEKSGLMREGALRSSIVWPNPAVPVSVPQL
jgi:hypothetical protein